MVRQEKLPWLSKNSGYTRRYALFVGRQCQKSTIKDVARELHLHWETVKELEKEYMRAKLDAAPEPMPEVIGIDEIAVGEGHDYRIVVSDLIEKRAIWFGGKDRSEESMDQFYRWLGTVKCKMIRLAVMDMWKAFETSARNHVASVAILYDKFHVISHLNKALDKVRKQEYTRLAGKNRKFIKGQKYTLLSRRKNLTTKGKNALKLLLNANKRLNIAYMLKESFGQLWDYESEAWARKFFDNWKASLKWQRLKPFEDFARLIEAHWDGIAAHCKPENKISLGYVEGLNNKIRVFQRRAYGLKDQEYFKLKVLTCTLPEIYEND
jgi:transposase